ncbi:uncharacterized mitochondrial protein AtMg00810-like [Mercurialis annua]|uniref:uncharacterized mitochondrial protein AtMg00810-like n=1 Tax=Mercurialis annua TaxID=3986 RepID=UPI00215E5F4F|nr:uncharacterized mitochondrial protein AtMg00810-like [Mercurialis annua]
MYRGMIGSLLYLTASRPNIMFSVCLCARFQACPKESHLHAVKRILKYLHGTLHLGIYYPRNVDPRLLGYFDADYAGCLIDRKSTSGTCQFLGQSLNSWSSNKQVSIALSTAEAKYVAAGDVVIEFIDATNQFADIFTKPLNEDRMHFIIRELGMLDAWHCANFSKIVKNHDFNESRPLSTYRGRDLQTEIKFFSLC